MRVAFDIGGTFADVVVLDDGRRLTTVKVLSLLDRGSEDSVACGSQATPAARVGNVAQGTTTASHAVIEKGIIYLSDKGIRFCIPRLVPQTVIRLLRMHRNGPTRQTSRADLENIKGRIAVTIQAESTEHADILPISEGQLDLWRRATTGTGGNVLWGFARRIHLPAFSAL